MEAIRLRERDETLDRAVAEGRQEDQDDHRRPPGEVVEPGDLYQEAPETLRQSPEHADEQRESERGHVERTGAGRQGPAGAERRQQRQHPTGVYGRIGLVPGGVGSQQDAAERRPPSHRGCDPLLCEGRAWQPTPRTPPSGS